MSELGGAPSHWAGRTVTWDEFKRRVLVELQNANKNDGVLKMPNGVSVKCSQSNIARLAGTSQPTISNAIKELRASGQWNPEAETERRESSFARIYDPSESQFRENPLIARFISDAEGVHKTRKKFVPLMFRILTGKVVKGFRVAPELLTKAIAEEFVSAYIAEYKEAPRREIRMALRRLCEINGITLLRGQEQKLSGEKDNFGRYSGVGADKKWEFYVYKMARFFERKGYWEAKLALAIMVNAFPRSRALCKVRASDFQLRAKGEPFRGIVYESKTKGDGKPFPKRYATREVCDTIFDWISTHRERTHIFLEGNFDVSAKVMDEKSAIFEFEKKLCAQFLEAYAEIGLISKDKNDWEKYPEGSEQWYLVNKALYTFRHVGAHYYLRRIGYAKSGALAKMGWDDPSMLTQVYAAMPDEELDSAVGIFHAGGVPCRVCEMKFTFSEEMERHITANHWVTIGEREPLEKVIKG